MKSLEERVALLEASAFRSTRNFFIAFSLGLLMASGGIVFANSSPPVIPEIRTNKLVVADRQGRVRVEIQEDEEGTERVSRAAGVTIFDAEGNERGGFGTLANGTAALVLDAPKGVGSTMPDRAMMGVLPDGSSLIGLNSNSGSGAVFLKASEMEGSIEISGHNSPDSPIETKVLTHK